MLRSISIVSRKLAAQRLIHKAFESQMTNKFTVPPNKFLQISCPFPLSISHWSEKEYMADDFDRFSGSARVIGHTNDPIAFVDQSEDSSGVHLKILPIPSEWLTGRAEVSLPVDIDVGIEMTHDAPLNLLELQLKSIEVEAGKGMVFMNNVKADMVSVLSRNGGVKTDGFVKANFEVESSEDVHVKHVEGDVIQLHSRDGEILVGSLYSKMTHLSTIKGNILIGSCHGNTKINSDVSYIQIDGMDGPLKINARKADCDIFAPKLDLTTVVVSEQGNIYLGLPETLEGTKITSVIAGESRVHEFTADPKKDTELRERTNSMDSRILLSTAQGNVKIAHEEFVDRASGKIGRGIGRTGFPLIVRTKQLRLFD